VALPNGEKMCNFYYPPSPTMYRFVNTGSWMGRVGAARKLLRDIETAHASEALGELNDQELVTDFFVCDYLQQLYAEGGDAAVLQRVGHVFGDTDAAKAAARIPGCNRLDGVVKYAVKLDYECVLFQSLHNSEVDQSIHAPQVQHTRNIRAWSTRKEGGQQCVTGVAHSAPASLFFLSSLLSLCLLLCLLSVR